MKEGSRHGHVLPRYHVATGWQPSARAGRLWPGGIRPGLRRDEPWGAGSGESFGGCCRGRRHSGHRLLHTWEVEDGWMGPHITDGSPQYPADQLIRRVMGLNVLARKRFTWAN